VTDWCTWAPEWEHWHHCKQHDIDYTFQIGKWKADWKLIQGITFESGLFAGVYALLGTQTVGHYFYWKAGREMI